MANTRVNHINFWIRENTPNHINLQLCSNAYEALDSPSHIIFDEVKKTIKIPGLEGKKGFKVYMQKGGGCTISIVLKHLDASELNGTWEYDINDLTLELTDKIIHT